MNRHSTDFPTTAPTAAEPASVEPTTSQRIAFELAEKNDSLTSREEDEVLSRLLALRRDGRGTAAARRTRFILSLAAGFATVLGVGLLYLNFRSGSTITLADGSIVFPGTPDLVQVKKDEHAGIRVHQNPGRARYEVVPRPKRPFLVMADGIDVEVRGTIFEVDSNEVRVRVTVERGLVAIRGRNGEVLVRPGETREMSRTPTSDPPRVTATATEDRTGVDPVTAVQESENTESMPFAKRGVAVKASQQTQGSTGEQDDFEAAQEARSRKDDATARALLQKFILSRPRDPRIVSAYFLLGRVERAQGAHAAAAVAFGKAATRAAGGTLAAEALIEEFASLEASGQRDLARKAASRYLRQFPDGPARQRMTEFLK